MHLTRSTLLAALCVSGPALAAEPVQPAQPAQGTTVGVDLQNDTLSNASPDWRALTLRVKRDLGPRRLAELALGTTRRFGLADTQLSGLYAWPVSALLSASVEASASPSHRVLARNALGATLQYEFAPAWLLHGGAKSTAYRDARVNQALLMLERYVGATSWALAWRPSRAFDTTAHSVELRAAYYYADKASIGLSVATGRETTSTGCGVVLAEVQALTLTGRHWVTPAWALNYALGHTRQGDFYSRKGISVGLAHAF